MKLTDILNENLARRRYNFNHRGLNVTLNHTNSDTTHVQDRTNRSQSLKIEQILEKFKKFLDYLIDNGKAPGNYIANFGKSKIRIPFKYKIANPRDVFLLTILEWNMKPHYRDIPINLDEQIVNLFFEAHDIKLENNSYDYITENEENDDSTLIFYNKEGKKSIDGIEEITLDI